MSDVLPKPFTKEGLLNMLEKQQGHLKHGSALLHKYGIICTSFKSAEMEKFKSADHVGGSGSWSELVLLPAQEGPGSPENEVPCGMR